jgi:hypothetical protein
MCSTRARTNCSGFSAIRKLFTADSPEIQFKPMSTINNVYQLKITPFYPIIVFTQI